MKFKFLTLGLMLCACSNANSYTSNLQLTMAADSTIDMMKADKNPSGKQLVASTLKTLSKEFEEGAFHLAIGYGVDAGIIESSDDIIKAAKKVLESKYGDAYDFKDMGQVTKGVIVDLVIDVVSEVARDKLGGEGDLWAEYAYYGLQHIKVGIAAKQGGIYGAVIAETKLTAGQLKRVAKLAVELDNLNTENRKNEAWNTASQKALMLRKKYKTAGSIAAKRKVEKEIRDMFQNELKYEKYFMTFDVPQKQFLINNYINSLKKADINKFNLAEEMLNKIQNNAHIIDAYEDAVENFLNNNFSSEEVNDLIARGELTLKIYEIKGKYLREAYVIRSLIQENGFDITKNDPKLSKYFGRLKEIYLAIDKNANKNMSDFASSIIFLSEIDRGSFHPYDKLFTGSPKAHEYYNVQKDLGVLDLQVVPKKMIKHNLEVQPPTLSASYEQNSLHNIVNSINNNSTSSIGSAIGYSNPVSKNSPNTQTGNAELLSNNNTQLTTPYEQSLLKQDLTIAAGDWKVTQGDPSVHLSIGDSFGSITAPNGNQIAALNNAGVPVTTMSRTYEVPNGVNNISTSFLANFVTNEYPEFVGTEFNDSVAIDVVTGSGNSYSVRPFTQELNSANLTAVSGLPNPMIDTGGQTGFQSVNVDDIPVANGGKIRIDVTSVNAGDDLYPSAILINDTTVKN